MWQVPRGLSGRLSGWLDDLLGMQCPLCEQTGRSGQLCPLCRTWLDPLRDPCPGCGAPDTLGSFCGRCQHRPPPWQRLRVAWPLTGACRFLIHRLKYHEDYASARALAKLWWQVQQRAQTQPGDLDALVPVPLHGAKLSQRGFNQAHWLASLLGRQAGLPLWQGVRKVRPTQALEGLNRRQRRRALNGVFELSAAPPPRLAIVDDVLTTGATCGELARQLTRAGVTRLEVWTLARTPLGD